MSKVLRRTAVLAVAGLAVPLWAVPALAETASEPAATGAYYSSTGVDKPEGLAADPMNPTGMVDGVQAEHLAVAVRQPGADDKKSYLAFDLDAVPFDATITRAVVTLPLAPSSPTNVQMSPGADKVMACAAGPEGFNSEDGAAIASAPTDTCDALQVVGKPDGDGTAYVFDVTAIARTWLSEANNGIALRPAVTTAPFQVVFLPVAMASIAVDFTAPPAETEVDQAPVDAPVGTTTDPGGGGGVAGDTSSFVGGSAGGSVGVPDTSSGVADAPAVDVGTLPVDVDVDADAAPAPQTAAQEDGEVVLDTVASSGLREVLSPTTGAWVGGLLLVGLLGLLGLIMGDPRVAAPGASAPSRLSLALQQRLTAVGTAGPRL